MVGHYCTLQCLSKEVAKLKKIPSKINEQYWKHLFFSREIWFYKFTCNISRLVTVKPMYNFQNYISTCVISGFRKAKRWRWFFVVFATLERSTNHSFQSSNMANLASTLVCWCHKPARVTCARDKRYTNMRCGRNNRVNVQSAFTRNLPCWPVSTFASKQHLIDFAGKLSGKTTPKNGGHSNPRAISIRW